MRAIQEAYLASSRKIAEEEEALAMMFKPSKTSNDAKIALIKLKSKQRSVVPAKAVESPDLKIQINETEFTH